MPAPAEALAGISAIAVAAAGGVDNAYAPQQTWERPTPPDGVLPNGMAMDALPAVDMTGAMFAYGLAQRFHEGLGFFGYPYLAELAQRPEYRMISETIARDATRKWIKLTGPDEAKLKTLQQALERHEVQAKFRRLSELDGFFGRSQLFVDNGESNLNSVLLVRPETIGKGKLKALVVVEPIWTYPGNYNASNPLAPDFYRPVDWYVMGQTVHRSRLLTIVSREVPDMLKPVYAFGGLSLSQMAKPYVDNWLRTRQSVSDLLHSFSTMVLATDMSSTLAGGNGQDLFRRVAFANQARDNRGLWVIDKENETLDNLSTPLGSLDDLQAQSQEQMASVAGIPLVVLLGITPSGLNATSDGEIRTYYDKIKSYQEKVFEPSLRVVIDMIQLDEFGAIDPEIGFEFLSLWEMDETALAAIRKSDAEADVGYVNAGIVDPEEVRERLAEDEGGLYFGVDLSAPAPEMEDDADVLAGEDPADGAQDAWNEADHPRDPEGKFGSGGGGTSGTGGMTFKQAVRMGAEIQATTKAASMALKAVPGVGSGGMGLTPQAVKETPEYQAAKAKYERAAETEREFAAKFNRHFAPELRAARQQHGPVWQKMILAETDD